jgi:chemotaxis protein histidine kinase CheA
MASPGGFLKYIKKAFLFRWNLLILGAGTVLGFVSGHPDIVLPLVAATEVAYLAGLSTHPKFQSAVEAEEHKAKQQVGDKQAAEKTRIMFDSLSNEDRRKFERLRGLCMELREISKGLKGDPTVEPVTMADLQSSGINRLLWIYLKLLYSKNALEQFFSTIDAKEIEDDLARTQQRIQDLGPAEKDTPNASKMRKSLEDHLATCQARLSNHQGAKEKYDLILVDLDRVSSKIASLGEMGINRQDPNYITNEVDAVSASVQQTEKAMGELQFLTGLGGGDETPPSLLDGPAQQKIEGR